MDAERGPYRDRLEVLATDGLVEGCLDAWAAQRSTESLGPWRRVYSKLRPRRSPWAVLVYEAERGPTVQVRLLDGASPTANGGLGPVEILSCTEDPALPGLPAVLEALDSPRVVRYHPGGRCTVRGSVDGGDRYVKVLSETADDQPEVRARWAASRAGALSFAVAEPHGWDARTLSSWYGVVPGESVIATCAGRGGPRWHVRSGRHWGSWHRRRWIRPRAWTPPPSWPAPSARWRAQPPPPRHSRPSCGRRAKHWRVSTNGWHGAPWCPRTERRTSGSGWWTTPVGWASWTSTGSPGVSRSTTWRRSSWKRRHRDEQATEIEDAVISGYHSVAPELDAERLALYVMHKRLAGWPGPRAPCVPMPRSARPHCSRSCSRR